MFIQGVNSQGEPIRSFYVEHDDYATLVADDGMTRQEFADECDINVLMATYERSGVINHFNASPPQYLDVSAVPDLAQSLAIVDAAQTAFMTLPATARREFDNDPVKFIAYAEDPANLGRMREWGLAPPAPALAPEPSVPAESKA
ncbi:internal scaffolding protein [Blackfly microvirus SF02]|uniref:Internal scaffolding protein n=1 Tax=Blackfly microvirus SF02 TaxID=2576452 RepID=A0A4P8PTM2_9VIRU|nr:internal scaffolding protein [Blackfly microvirus SF02]